MQSLECTPGDLCSLKILREYDEYPEEKKAKIKGMFKPMVKCDLKGVPPVFQRWMNRSTFLMVRKELIIIVVTLVIAIVAALAAIGSFIVAMQ